MATTPELRPNTSTGTLLATELPRPSCPLLPAPQHFTPPALVSAHMCSQPALSAITPPSRPDTSTGVLRLRLLPSPTWPEPLRPQHRTAPSSVNAQVE